MAIDTAAKRSAAVDHEETWSSGMPVPTGVISTVDRWHVLMSYYLVPVIVKVVLVITGVAQRIWAYDHQSGVTAVGDPYIHAQVDGETAILRIPNPPGMTLTIQPESIKLGLALL